MESWVQPAVNKPSITALSKEHGFLVFLLCLFSLEIGTYLGQAPVQSHGAVTNLIVCGALLLNSLAFTFRWSQAVTIILRGTAVAWLVLMITSLFFCLN